MSTDEWTAPLDLTVPGSFWDDVVANPTVANPTVASDPAHGSAASDASAGGSGADGTGRGRAPGSRIVVQAGVVALCTGVTGLLVGRAAQSVAGDRMAPWILGRASGICSYLLLVALVSLGLLLSHPARARWTRPSAALRIRAHVSLAVFTAAFVVIHVVVLATDAYAHVGWWGALLPMASQYRPLPVTMGVIALYSGLLAGVTAGLAGRWASRVWWPVHKVAAVSLVLTFLHGILSGADSPVLVPLYVVSALGVGVLAASRYGMASRFGRPGRAGGLEGDGPA